MALTAQKWQRRVQNEAGAPLAGVDRPAAFRALYAALAAEVPTLWEMEGGRLTVYLQYLYTKKAAVDFVRAQFTTYRDVQMGRGGLRALNSQVFKAVSDLYKDTLAEIVRHEAALAASGAAGTGGPSAGSLAAGAPAVGSLVSGRQQAASAAGGLLDPGAFGGNPLDAPPLGWDWFA